jgi:hypothetical protein
LFAEFASLVTETPKTAALLMPKLLTVVRLIMAILIKAHPVENPVPVENCKTEFRQTFNAPFERSILISVEVSNVNLSLDTPSN